MQYMAFLIVKRTHLYLIFLMSNTRWYLLKITCHKPICDDLQGYVKTFLLSYNVPFNIISALPKTPFFIMIFSIWISSPLFSCTTLSGHVFVIVYAFHVTLLSNICSIP